ncbi:hypothetical protein BDN67DRAFT_971226, partial [Paxillus ammoniavirescens]
MGFYDAPDGQMIANCYVGRVSNVAQRQRCYKTAGAHIRGSATTNGSCLEARQVMTPGPGPISVSASITQSFPQDITAAKTASAV